jgi:hypothetical protein
MWMYRLGLERSKRLLLTGDAIDGRRASSGAGLRGGPAERARRGRPRPRAARRAAAANQLHMMKLLVNQAFEQMGLRRPSSSARCSTARRATRRRARPSRRGARGRRAARWPSATPVRRLRPGARRCSRWPARPIGVVLAGGVGPPHRRRQGDWSSSRAGRWCSTRSRAARGSRRGGGRGQAVDLLPPLDAEVGDLAGGRGAASSALGVVHALRCARGRPSCRCRATCRSSPAARRRPRPRALARRAGLVPRAAGALQPLCARYDPRALTARSASDFGRAA